MAKTSLSTAKAHLRIDIDDAAQDALIGLYLDAAEEHVESWCDRSFGNPLPKAVTAAALLVLGGLFETRDAWHSVKLEQHPAVDRLLRPFRSYAGYFGQTALPPAAVTAETEILIGDDWSRVWRWTNEDGTAIDVTGYTGVFDLFDGETVVHTGALVVSDAAGGEFTFGIDDAITAELSAIEYWYRVRVTSPGGEVTTLDRKRVPAK